MTDHPMIFSAPMVHALIEGRKTQTRRVLTPQPAACTDHVIAVGPNWLGVAGDGVEELLRVPYAPGDRIWVKEAWRTPDNFDRPPREMIASCVDAGWSRAWAPIQWEADGSRDNWGDWRQHSAGRLRSPLHLPRAYCRLTLTVTDVRVQRVQEITEADARAEGVEWESADPPFYYVPGIWPHSTTAVGVEEAGSRHAARSFGKLWDHINTKRGRGWDANDWVAALTFTVERRNIDAAAP